MTGRSTVPVKNGFEPPKKIEPLNGVIFIQSTSTFRTKSLESLTNRAKLLLVMCCIFLSVSIFLFEAAVHLIIVLAKGTPEF